MNRRFYYSALAHPYIICWDALATLIEMFYKEGIPRWIYSINFWCVIGEICAAVHRMAKREQHNIMYLIESSSLGTQISCAKYQSRKWWKRKFSKILSRFSRPLFHLKINLCRYSFQCNFQFILFFAKGIIRLYFQLQQSMAGDFSFPYV